MERRTGTRLGTALLVYMLGVTLIITLLPFQFAWPEQWNVVVGDDPYDFVLNVVLFVPLGFLYRMVTPRGRGSMMLAVVKAAVISTAIEAAQLFDAPREPTLLDIVANTFGAWVGAAGFDRIARSARVSGQVIGWLGLEIPLMGLVYLVMPLLWVSTLAARGDPLKTFATFLVGAFGAYLLGGLQRHYFGPSRAAEPHRTAAFAAIWFVAGAFPMFPWRPLELAGSAVALALLCWWQGKRSPPQASGANRRFEAPLLRAAAWIYGAYLLTLVVFPVLGGAGEWHGYIGYPDGDTNRTKIGQLLELCAAFTLVGYMAAEIRGREVTNYRDAVPRLIAWGVGLAVAAEIARGFDVYGASLSRGALLVIACMFGGWLYYLQRAHVMALVSQHRPEKG